MKKQRSYMVNLHHLTMYDPEFISMERLRAEYG